jgi:hypothetical protein
MGIIPNIGNGKYRDVSIEGEAVQHRAIDDSGNHHVVVFSTGDGPDIEFQFYSEEVRSSYNGTYGGCFNGDHLCAITAALIVEQDLSVEEELETRRRLNCGCANAETNEYEEVGREILAEAGIESITSD